jgi:allophanate hydrolase subunit 1
MALNWRARREHVPGFGEVLVKVDPDEVTPEEVERVRERVWERIAEERKRT